MIKVRKFAFFFVSFIRYASKNKMSLHVECVCVIVDLFHMNSLTRASTNLTILSASANGDPQFFFLFSFSCQIHSTKTYNHKTCICRTRISTRRIDIIVFFSFLFLQLTIKKKHSSLTLSSIVDRYANKNLLRLESSI